MDANAEQVEVKILFFAKARELTGLKECKIIVSRKLSYTELLDTIVASFHFESIRDTLILAVNEEFVSQDSILELSEKNEIAVIPPLSGGFFIVYYL